jgi:hypothetical protein
LSEYQRHVVEDGAIAFAEYEQATFDFVSCVQSAGGTVSGVDGGKLVQQGQPTLNGRHQYDYSIGGSNDAKDRLLPEFDRCRAEYISFIEPIWRDLTRPSEREFQMARRAIGECLRTRGIEVPEDPSSQQLFDIGTNNGRDPLSAEYLECAYRIQEEFDVPGFAG